MSVIDLNFSMQPRFPSPKTGSTLADMGIRTNTILKNAGLSNTATMTSQVVQNLPRRTLPTASPVPTASRTPSYAAPYTPMASSSVPMADGVSAELSPLHKVLLLTAMTSPAWLAYFLLPKR